MKGLENFLSFINSYWTDIVVIIGLLLAIGTKIVSYSKLTKQQKIDAAMKIIKNELLKLMSEAEINWEDYKKSGDIKKSEVLAQIYEQFPFLKEYIDQDTLIQKITDMIDEEKKKMDEIINNIPIDTEK